MNCTTQTWLGAYVLDALEPDETEDVRAHIAGCAACQDEVVRLAWLPALLGTVRLADVAQLDADLIRREPARRRGWKAALVGLAAAVTLATAGAVAIREVGPGGPPRPLATVVRTVDPSTKTHAAVTLAARAWGTELHLQLSWVPAGERCSLIARSRDGRADIAASWIATYRGTADVPGNTAIPIGQLAELDVVTADGRQLARLVMPHGGP